MSDLNHALFMGDDDELQSRREDAWDRNLSTDELVKRVTDQLYHETDGSEITIKVVTTRPVPEMTLTELCDALRRPGPLPDKLAAEAFRRLRAARRDGDEDTERSIVTSFA